VAGPSAKPRRTLTPADIRTRKGDHGKLSSISCRSPQPTALRWEDVAKINCQTPLPLPLASAPEVGLSRPLPLRRSCGSRHWLRGPRLAIRPCPRSEDAGPFACNSKIPRSAKPCGKQARTTPARIGWAPSGSMGLGVNALGRVMRRAWTGKKALLAKDIQTDAGTSGCKSLCAGPHDGESSGAGG